MVSVEEDQSRKEVDIRHRQEDNRSKIKPTPVEDEIQGFQGGEEEFEEGLGGG